MGALIALPLNKLKLSPSNIRKQQSGKIPDKELKASIKAQGILQNLIVTEPKGKSTKYIVHAGSRRFRFGSELIKEGDLPKEYLFPCMIDDSDHPEEAALSENIHRVGMHPVDEFETFNRLHFKENMAIADISRRHGKPKIEIQKRLKLAGVHPKLREICRNGDIDIDALEAYSISDDQEQQLKAYDSLENYNRNSPHHIRQALTQNYYKSDHKLIKFIGLQNYTRAGGTTSTDLFNAVKYVHDLDLIEQLAKEKLAAAAEKAKGDWSWIDIDLDFYNKPIPYSRIQPGTVYSEELTARRLEVVKNLKTLESELEAMEENEGDTSTSAELANKENEIAAAEAEMEAIDDQAKVYTDDQKRAAGCVLVLKHDGTVIIEEGFVKKQDKQKAQSSPQQDGGQESLAPAEHIEYSNALENDLQAWRLSAAKTELLYNPDIMHRLLLFTCCWDVFGSDTCYKPGPCNINIQTTFTESSKNDIEGSRMHQEFLEYRKNLNLTWVQEHVEESWTAFQGIDDKDLKKLVGYIACYALNGSLRSEDDPSVLDMILDNVDAKLGKHWRPTYDTFFKRINRATLDQDGADIRKDDHFADTYKSKAKSEIGQLLDYDVADMDNSDCWLPNGF